VVSKYFHLDVPINDGSPRLRLGWGVYIFYTFSIGFCHIHIFSYSRRESTKAAGLPGQFAEAVKKRRNQQLHQLAVKSKKNLLLNNLGKTFKVLWENESMANTGRISGHTPNYLRIQALAKNVQSGSISEVTASGLSDNADTFIAQELVDQADKNNKILL